MPKTMSMTRQAVMSREKRATRRDAETCVNGKAAITNGTRCLRCHLVRKHGAAIAKAMLEYQSAPLCNP